VLKKQRIIGLRGVCGGTGEFATLVYLERDYLHFVVFWRVLCGGFYVAGFVRATGLAFVRSGPFAWNALFPFWIAGAVFVAWFLGLAWGLLRAVRVEGGGKGCGYSSYLLHSAGTDGPGADGRLLCPSWRNRTQK
jgi:hypothetical protein